MGQEHCWQVGNQLKAQRMINEKCQDLGTGIRSGFNIVKDLKEGVKDILMKLPFHPLAPALGFSGFV